MEVLGCVVVRRHRAYWWRRRVSGWCSLRRIAVSHSEASYTSCQHHISAKQGTTHKLLSFAMALAILSKFTLPISPSASTSSMCLLIIVTHNDAKLGRRRSSKWVTVRFSVAGLRFRGAAGFLNGSMPDAFAQGWHNQPGLSCAARVYCV